MFVHNPPISKDTVILHFFFKNNLSFAAIFGLSVSLSVINTSQISIILILLKEKNNGWLFIMMDDELVKGILQFLERYEIYFTLSDIDIIQLMPACDRCYIKNQ